MVVRVTDIPMADVKASYEIRDRLVTEDMNVSWDSIEYTFQFLWDYVEEKIKTEIGLLPTNESAHTLHIAHGQFGSGRFVIGVCLSYFDLNTKYAWIPAIATRPRPPVRSNRLNGPPVIVHNYTMSENEIRSYRPGGPNYTEYPPANGWRAHHTGFYRSNTLLTHVLRFHGDTGKGIKLCSIEGAASRYTEFGFVFDDTEGINFKPGFVRFLNETPKTRICMSYDFEVGCVIMRWDVAEHPDRAVRIVRRKLKYVKFPIRRSRTCTPVGQHRRSEKVPSIQPHVPGIINWIDVDTLGVDPVADYDMSHRRAPIRVVRSGGRASYHPHKRPQAHAPRQPECAALGDNYPLGDNDPLGDREIEFPNNVPSHALFLPWGDREIEFPNNVPSHALFL
jgi:hypothetical protein